MNKARITNITRQQNGKKYANVLKRERWVRYLKEHELRSQLSPSESSNSFQLGLFSSNRLRFASTDYPSSFHYLSVSQLLVFSSTNLPTFLILLLTVFYRSCTLHVVFPYSPPTVDFHFFAPTWRLLASLNYACCSHRPSTAY